MGSASLCYSKLPERLEQHLQRLRKASSLSDYLARESKSLRIPRGISWAAAVFYEVSFNRRRDAFYFNRVVEAGPAVFMRAIRRAHFVETGAPLRFARDVVGGDQQWLGVNALLPILKLQGAINYHS